MTDFTLPPIPSVIPDSTINFGSVGNTLATGGIPALPSLDSGSTTDFSNAFAMPGSTSAFNFNLPSTLAQVNGTTANGNSTTSTAAAGATASQTSASGCSGFDITCWFGALVGRAGIVVLGLLMLAVALWMLADKANVLPTVSVKA